MDEKRFNELYDQVGPAQNRKAFHTLVNYAEALNPQVIIEIGVQEGRSLKLWEQILPPRGLLIGIDINPRTYEYIRWDWRNSDRRIELIIGDGSCDGTHIGDSTCPLTVEKVRQILGDRKVDVLFIDGGHAYSDVKSDFQNYSPFVRKGGIVGFHDIKPEAEPGIAKFFFRELKGKKESLEEEGSQAYGTGVWFKE